MIRVWLDGVDVTYWVVTRDLPEWLETSVKGPGWFEWRVSSFAFRLHDRAPVTLAIGMVCVVSVGAATLSGQIGKLEDTYTHVPRITVDPPALALKEVMAGSQGFAEDGRLRWVFELSGATLQEAAEQLLSTYNTERPAGYPARSWSVRVLGDPENPVQGLGPHELTGPDDDRIGYGVGLLASINSTWEGDFTFTAEDVIQLRTDENGVHMAVPYYAGTRDGQEMRLRVVTFPPAGPPSDNVLRGETYPQTVHHNWVMSPDAAFLLFRQNGTEAGISTNRVDLERALSWVESQAGAEAADSTELDVVAIVDFEHGSWAFVRAITYDDQGTWVHMYAAWWSDPLVQLLRGRWANKSMAELLQVYALVTGHMLKFDESTVVFVPRTDGEVTVIDPDPALALKPIADCIETVAPPEVNLETQDPEEDEDNRWGLDYGAGDVVALNWWYVDRFGGPVPVRDAEFPIALLPENARLLAASGAGTWTELDFSTDGERFRYHTIREGA